MYVDILLRRIQNHGCQRIYLINDIYLHSKAHENCCNFILACVELFDYYVNFAYFIEYILEYSRDLYFTVFVLYAF